MNFRLRRLNLALASLMTFPVYSVHADEQLAPVTVNADLRQTELQDIPASVDVKNEAQIKDQGATHFEDLLLKTPNVNFSGQSSRPRHIQIRGIGGRDEYTGAPNSSVGFAIDDIDFSGIGMAANLFDVKQVEVLKGPQNTRYGQNAIAGLINIESNDPTPYEEGMFEGTVGQDNLRELGIVTSGPFGSESDSTQYRFSLFSHNSDGFRHNETLNRDDTNGRSELTLRGKLRFFLDDVTTLDVTLLHADLNNGYDAWSRDNSFTTLSNQPGQDTLLTNAAAFKLNWKGNPNFDFTSRTNVAFSDMTYSYDEDWTAASAGTYLNNKQRHTFNQELRWTSTPQSKINGNTDWLAGLYASRLVESNETEYWGSSSSDFSINKLAAFGQLDYAMNSKATITLGSRIENDSSDFTNSNNEHYSPDDTLWGANLTYSYRYNDVYTAYMGINRGYKAGGFNAGQPAGTPNTYLFYQAETLMNYEIGLKVNYADLGLSSQITAFYMDRSNPQFDAYTYDPSSGTNWVFYTENFDSAKNYGVEGNLDWQINRRFNLFASLGLLKTEVSGTPLNSGFTIDGREQAHAPNYQFNIGGKYRSAAGFYAEADLTGVDSFYFDNTHDVRSDAYRILNARVGYEGQDYEIYLWGKNITDETYATRGFYFDFNPPWTNPSKYVRLGDPRQYGITYRLYF
ncbi:TonB-dependent receptor [Thiomicrorhabdus sp.]|uniref:TonB-dependent receptor n=1 Tax=Thiomicrorhabdus sp. TaxID=2039724 RepID=UPI0029C61B51|nr:TonB-dependent receptor [Thiomicrorhabdus sp.]